MIELLSNNVTITAVLMTILGIIAGSISSVVVRKLREIKIKKYAMKNAKIRYIERSIIKHRIVLKDDKKKLYTFEKDGDIINEILLDFGKNAIIHSVRTDPDGAKKGLKIVNVDPDDTKIDLKIVNTDPDNAKIDLDLAKAKIANDAESLAFKFAISAHPSLSFKDPKRNISSVNIAKDVDLMMKLLQKKIKSNTFTYFALVFSLFIELLLGTLNPLFFNNRIILLTCILIILSFTNQLILKYRVKKGLYGTSYLEAREIITFIFNEQNNGGNGRGKTKLVFPKEENEQNVLLNRIRGEEHAQ